MFFNDKLSDLISKPVEKTADPFSLDSLIGWLEKQPASEIYCWLDTGACLFSQYAVHLGYPASAAGYMQLMNEYTRVGVRTEGEPFGNLAINFPHTFGGALSRALSLRDGAV